MAMPRKRASQKRDSPKKMVRGGRILTTLLLVPWEVGYGVSVPQKVSKESHVLSQILVKLDKGVPVYK